MKQSLVKPSRHSATKIFVHMVIKVHFDITLTFELIGPYSETWYKAIPAVLLGSVSRENPKVSVLRLFRIQR